MKNNVRVTRTLNHWNTFQRQARQRLLRINGEASFRTTGWHLGDDGRDAQQRPFNAPHPADIPLQANPVVITPTAAAGAAVEEMNRWDDDGGATNVLACSNARLAVLEPDDPGVTQAAEPRFPFSEVANARQTSTGFLIQMSPRVQTVRVSGETVALAERSDEAGEETGWSDLNRDLIRELARRLGSLNRLHGMLRRARFHGELRECWRDLRRQEQDLVARLRRLLLGSFQDTTQ